VSVAELDRLLLERFGRKVRRGGALNLAGRFSLRKENSTCLLISTRPECPGPDALPRTCEHGGEQMFGDGRRETMRGPGPGSLRPGLPPFLDRGSLALLRTMRRERSRWT